MKKLYVILLITFSCFGWQYQINAQCEPDIVTCIDTGVPGQICPLDLPDGIIDQAYEQVVTIIPPYEYDFGTGVLPIVKIELTKVENLPIGISYEANAEIFYADTAYCILLSGTPTIAGQYDLVLHILPTILFFGEEVQVDPVVDDTSLTITINPPIGITQLPYNTSKFSISPNPFNNIIIIKYKSDIRGVAILNIFDTHGRKVYQSKLNIQTGNNEFLIEGDAFCKGIYFIRFQTNTELTKKKLVKLF